VTYPNQDALSRAKCSLAAEVVRQHGQLRLRVTGLSMLPAVWPGDIVTVERQEPAHVQSGELVLVEHEGRLRLHRLVARQRFRETVCLVTRGDSLSTDDPPVLPAQVLGVVTSIQRRGKALSPQRSPAKLAWLFSNSYLGAWTARVALHWRALLARKETLRIVS